MAEHPLWMIRSPPSDAHGGESCSTYGGQKAVRGSQGYTFFVGVPNDLFLSTMSNIPPPLSNTIKL